MGHLVVVASLDGRIGKLSMKQKSLRQGECRWAACPETRWRAPPDIWQTSLVQQEAVVPGRRVLLSLCHRLGSAVFAVRILPGWQRPLGRRDFLSWPSMSTWPAGGLQRRSASLGIDRITQPRVCSFASVREGLRRSHRLRLLDGRTSKAQKRHKKRRQDYLLS